MQRLLSPRSGCLRLARRATSGAGAPPGGRSKHRRLRGVSSRNCSIGSRKSKRGRRFLPDALSCGSSGRRAIAVAPEARPRAAVPRVWADPAAAPRRRTRARKVEAIEESVAKREHEEAVEGVRRDRDAVRQARETSLRFHLYRVERPLPAGERKRARRLLQPCGGARGVARLSPAELLELVEGEAQKHRQNALLWDRIEWRCLAHARVLAPGELARVLGGFAAASAPRPTRLLSVASGRIAQESHRCTLADLAAAVHALGVMGVRDTRLLEACSVALRPLLEEASRSPPDGVALGPTLSRLSAGLAAVRWPDADLLRSVAQIIAAGLAPAPAAGLQTIPGPDRVLAPNLFRMPDAVDEDAPEVLDEADVARVCACFAALEIRPEALVRAVVADVVAASKPGADPRRRTSGAGRPWSCPASLGTVAASLAKLGVTDPGVTAQWLRAVRLERRRELCLREPGRLVEAQSPKMKDVFSEGASGGTSLGEERSLPKRTWEH